MTRFQALVVVATVWLAGACGAAADGHEALAEKFESYVCGAAPACAARDISDHSLDYGAWLAAHVPPGQVALTADSLVAMADAVRAGAGLGLLLCLLAEPDRELVRLTDPLPELDTQVWILTHPDLCKVRRVQALTDHLMESLGRHPFLVRVDQASMPPRAARARR